VRRRAASNHDNTGVNIMAKLTKTYTVTMTRTRTFEQVAHVEIEARHAAEAWEIAA